ncbi:hypothetical protein BDR26DRAFT_818175 [Obelidium mucronatum]|nr:hypothetical protein BDR26DRAFT_818175 [Obelidium mucronatum]
MTAVNPQTRVLLYQLLFLGTGVVSTLGAQWVKYRGAANSWSFLTSLCYFLGMFLVVALPPPQTLQQNMALKPKEDGFANSLFHRFKSHLDRYGKVTVKGTAFISVLEVVGNLILVAGMYLTGSGLMIVIYSSIVVFTAVFSRLLLPGRRLSTVQWVSVFAICFGLSITAVGSTGHHDKSGEAIFVGIFVCMLATAILSLVYVGTDHCLSNEMSTPYSQSIYVGMFSSLLTLIVMIAISIPTLLTLPLFDSDVIFAHLILILSSLGHSVAYFQLVESTGGVATGVLQGLRAVLVFGLSHVWFCGRDEAQCFTTTKGISTVIVVSGVVAFAAAKGMVAGAPKLATTRDSVVSEVDEELNGERRLVNGVAVGASNDESGDILLKNMERRASDL